MRMLAKVLAVIMILTLLVVYFIPPYSLNISIHNPEESPLSLFSQDEELSLGKANTLQVYVTVTNNWYCCTWTTGAWYNEYILHLQDAQGTEVPLASENKIKQGSFIFHPMKFPGQKVVDRAMLYKEIYQDGALKPGRYQLHVERDGILSNNIAINVTE